ncbi:MAG TPA: YciI family protein [Cyclobacteriaceae bacterium]|nr:YciI family protein [Cyclobacteriaceae bacterium]
MEKFLLLIREDISKINQTEELLYESIREMDEWVRGLVKTNTYLFGDALISKGRYVSKDKVLSDGPFIEAKEAVSGYIVIQAGDLQQASAIAQSCPHVQHENMVIEVRPLMGLKDVRELGDVERTASTR